MKGSKGMMGQQGPPGGKGIPVNIFEKVLNLLIT